MALLGPLASSAQCQSTVLQPWGFPSALSKWNSGVVSHQQKHHRYGLWSIYRGNLQVMNFPGSKLSLTSHFEEYYWPMQITVAVWSLGQLFQSWTTQSPTSDDPCGSLPTLGILLNLWTRTHLLSCLPRKPCDCSIKCKGFLWGWIIWPLSSAAAPTVLSHQGTGGKNPL